MTNLSSRKGSALLIVLGMIGVMVISAVAFSAYMRYSRLPSSYLRRTSSSRHLAHAAMAEAIDIIDASIGDNPHPGVGQAATLYPRETGRSEIRNYWRDHCYIGTNELVSSDETVSVLTLEALAYIPPALVNEIRYYSRHSTAAKWKTFGYDAGRFAFCAIDVSDHFDVNRVPADFGRNSSDGGKFSLAFALENNAHTSYTISPSQWDSFLDSYVDIDALRSPETAPSKSKMPFVSLADLGLALYYNSAQIAGAMFPVMTYLASGGSLLNGIEDLPSADMIRRFNVVADGLYPSSSQMITSEAVTKGQKGDISRRQPFKNMKQGNAKATNRDVLTSVDTGISSFISDNMTQLDLISLYDYLDENNVPVSLALPTVERNPMICGFAPYITLTLTPDVSTTDDKDVSSLKEGETFLRTEHCKLTVAAKGLVPTLYMFPFLKDKDAPVNGYTPETAIRICFGTESPGLRTPSGSPYIVASDSDFNASGVGGNAMQAKVAYGLGEWNSWIGSQASTPNKSPDNALLHLTGANVNTTFSDWFQNNDLFSVTKEMVMVKDVSTGSLNPQELDKSKRKADINDNFIPVANKWLSDRSRRAGFVDDIKKMLVDEGAHFMVRPYMTIASRIKTVVGDTVDLVPASFEDDSRYNGVNNDKNFANIGGGGDSQPIMTFCGDKEIELSLEAFTSGKGNPISIVIAPTAAQSVFCPDPRWNFAPENFVRVNEPLRKEWYTDDSNPASGIGFEGRDRDLFMFVSNQGYMQSVSELAFLPRTTWDFPRMSNVEGMNTGDAAFSFDYLDFPDSRDRAKNWKLMWRTYRLYSQGGFSSDDLYDIGLFDGGRGFRMTPYTKSHHALLSAIANPPYSWWAASTNNQDKSLETLSAAEFNRDYAFSPMNGNARLEWNEVENLASVIGRAMRGEDNSAYKGDWCEEYDSLEWRGFDFISGTDNSMGRRKIVGETVSTDLYDVDRKFLYGFWRDCFAAKQQLFLVFVRAEPMMMGGGAAGQAPPQLGARAMALVWRNPAAGNVTGIAGGETAWPNSLAETRDNVLKDNMAEANPALNRPHKTRVLFYRQFD